MNQNHLKFKIRATAPDLFFTARFNGTEFFAGPVPTESVEITYQFNDAPVDNVLELELSNKLPEHTKVDAQGNIVEDRLLEITDLALADTQLGYAVTEHSTYTHTATGDVVNFYGNMGVNGTVRFEFSGPTYLWLLENV